MDTMLVWSTAPHTLVFTRLHCWKIGDTYFYNSGTANLLRFLALDLHSYFTFVPGLNCVFEEVHGRGQI